MRRVVERLQGTQGRPAGLRERTPRVGQPDAPTVTLQELEADRLLEVMHLLGDGSLGQEQLRRGLRDVLGLGDRDERADLLEAERRPGHADILAALMEPITNNRS